MTENDADWQRYVDGWWLAKHMAPAFNAPWRGQMAKAWRAVKACKVNTFIRPNATTLPLDHVHRRFAWHLEWYNYGRSLRAVAPREDLR